MLVSYFIFYIYIIVMLLPVAISIFRYRVISILTTESIKRYPYRYFHSILATVVLVSICTYTIVQQSAVANYLCLAAYHNDFLFQHLQIQQVLFSPNISQYQPNVLSSDRLVRMQANVVPAYYLRQSVFDIVTEPLKYGRPFRVYISTDNQARQGALINKNRHQNAFHSVWCASSFAF